MKESSPQKYIRRRAFIYTNPLNSSRQSLLEFSRRRWRRGLHKTAIGEADCSPRSGRSPKLEFLLEFRGIVLSSEKEISVNLVAFGFCPYGALTKLNVGHLPYKSEFEEVIYGLYN